MIPFPFQTGGLGLAGSQGDPYWNSVISLMHFDGTNGATTFVDQKLGNGAWTAAGNAQLSTGQAKFGPTSLLLDGTTDYLTSSIGLGSLTDFQANVDFTLEMQVRATALATIDYLATKRNTGSGREWSFFLSAGQLMLAVFDNAGVQRVNLASTTILGTGGSFRAIAFTREGNTWRIFIDGNLEASQTIAFTYGVNSDAVTIGRDPSTVNRDFAGNIDEWRVTRGVARYTANYTPQTEAFPNS